MSKRYEPSSIESKWQSYWELHQTFKTDVDGSKPKKYILDMFPYPSGAGLHVGHPEGYTASDILSRFYRSTGHAVLHPMGWDAFGLPAEQYAIQTGTHPRDTTVKNIDNFRRQIKSLGLSYDWSREIDTTDPNYFKWTQWIFLKLFEKGLAYQAEVPVNWCAALGTVLANEEVKDGKSERGGYPVVRVSLRQWMLKITAYADRLLDGLQDVDWPEGTRTMQTEWIGRSEGAEVSFVVDGHPNEKVQVFTTRPDTLFGATFVVLAPEHPLVGVVTTDAQRAEVSAYVQATKSRGDLERKAAKEKTGVWTGGFVSHPLTGDKLPIWIADYVLWGYGTGAVMAVPAHDARDAEFAEVFQLPLIQVVQTADGSVDGNGVLMHSPGFDGLQNREGGRSIVAALQQKGFGKSRVEYKLRDWVFSRQRYWGEPIPVYFPVETQGDPRKGDAFTVRFDQPLAVDASELPLTLPTLSDFSPGDDPAGPLARAVDWRFFQKNGAWFARETNTMPQWAGSCWYYLRYMDPGNHAQAWSPEAAARWLPVDMYIGGAEHAVLHLLYARFWHHVLHDLGLVSAPEPFRKLVHQGMILGEVEADGRAYKMSKSRGNVVNPDEIVSAFGADAMRLYEMFMGPLEATKPWNTQSIQGVRRFLDRSYGVVTKPITDVSPSEALLRMVHRTIRKVTEDIEALRFNTAISAMMVLVNELVGMEEVPRMAAETLTLLLHPFAPHLGEELWEILGHSPSVQNVTWPTFDPALCEEDTLEVPVQINGKVRGALRVSKQTTEEEVQKLVAQDADLQAHLVGKTVKQLRWVPGRIVSIVAT